MRYENSLPVGFAGYWLFLANGQPIPAHFAANQRFDCSMRQMNWAGQSGRSGLTFYLMIDSVRVINEPVRAELVEAFRQAQGERVLNSVITRAG